MQNTSESLTSTLFRKGVLLKLQLQDGTDLQGQVVDVNPEGILLRDDEGNQTILTSDLLTHALYLYSGFPTQEAEVEVPVTVAGNGYIRSYNGKIGFTDNQFVIQPDSLLDATLRQDAQAFPASIVDREVLVVVEEGAVKKAYLLSVGALDAVLDKIAELAAMRKYSLARRFCELLSKQFPEDSDIANFLQKLQDATNSGKMVDFYQPIQSAEERQQAQDNEELLPMGRIFEMNNYKNGYIIDVRSHKKLFFHREQLLGELERKSTQELIGQPVVYSITRVNDKLQARSIMVPMQVDDALQLAEVKYRQKDMTLTACDILRIILQQYEDDYIARTYSQWKAKREFLFWSIETLPNYQGQPVSLRRSIEVPGTSTKDVNLERKTDHTQMEMGFAPPECPKITFTSEEPEELIAIEPEPDGELPEAPQEESEEADKTIDETPSETELQPAWAEVRKEPEEVFEMPTEEEIAASEGAESVVQPNARLTYHYGDGILYDRQGEQYSFTLDDIIDDTLFEEVRNKNNNSDDYVREREVICQLYESGGRRARNICRPLTVHELLRMALDAYNTEDLDSRDLEYINGLIGNVLDYIPNNMAANRMYDVVRMRRDTDSETCYKAPAGVKPFGTISTINCEQKPQLKISDPHFRRPIPFQISEIIDRGYDHQCHGDELMYSIYTNEQGEPIARFVHRAKSESELFALAEDWAGKGEVVKAWAIMMNLLDLNPDNERAKLLAADYENHADEQGAPFVGEELKQGRQFNDLLAQARFCAERGELNKALELYAQELQDPREPDNRAYCIRESIQIYSKLYHDDPTDTALLADYRRFGDMYINSENGFANQTKKVLENIRVVIIYHQDMEEPDNLIRALRRLLPLLQNPTTWPRLNGDPQSIIAATRAELAWSLLRQGNNQEAEDMTRLSERSFDNEKARMCRAVIEERKVGTEKNIRWSRSFRPYNVYALDTCDCRVSVQQSREKKGLIYHRFKMLCQLLDMQNESLSQGTRMDESSRTLLMKLLAGYVSTLLCDDWQQYARDKFLHQYLPGDCQLVLQLSRCVSKGLSWNGWMDLRLMSMLCGEAAYAICSILFSLNRDQAIDLLRNSHIEISYENKAVTPQFYAGRFNEWRGENFRDLLIQVLRKSEELVKRPRLSDCADFFRQLTFEAWMSQDDSDLITALRQQLPILIAAFLSSHTENARTIINAYQSLTGFLTDKTEAISQRPTVFSAVVLDPLLKKILSEAQLLYDRLQFEAPLPKATVISTSLVGTDGSFLTEVQVCNARRMATPMKDLHLIVDHISGGVQTEKPIIYSDISKVDGKVYGEEYVIYTIRARLTGDWQQQRSGQLQLRLLFTNEEGTHLEASFELPFPIQEWTEQTPKLPEIYAAGPKVEDEKMFYGRDDDVAAVVSAVGATKNKPHYFIFGQKRSGKSSLLYHIQKKLLANYHFISVEMAFADFTIHSEEHIYRHIFSAVQTTLDWDYDISVEDWTDADEASADSMTFSQFVNNLKHINKTIEASEQWHDYRLIFFIDEFTTSYEWFVRGKIPKEFFGRWKSLQDKGLFSAVLIGQDVFRYIVRDLVHNDFGSLLNLELTYLSREAAMRLVTDPVVEASGNADIYVGNAVQRILYYSANSAYYTQWICSELIKYVNANRLQLITEADVEECVHRMMNDDPNELKVKFSPLEYSGRDPKESWQFPREETVAVLRQVALAEISDPVRGCPRWKIHSENGRTDEFLADLVERHVLTVDNDNYKLIVKLYLLYHGLSK